MKSLMSSMYEVTAIQTKGMEEGREKKGKGKKKEGPV